MKLPKWEKRPEVTANLLNPAFCSEIIRNCIQGYKGEKNENMPFSLIVLVLPIILTNRIRERLPKTKSNTIHAWLNVNEDVKIGFPSLVKSYIPFSKEALMFGITHNSLSVDEEGNIDVRKRKGKLNIDDPEIKSCINKAVLLGKLFSKSGTPVTTYSIFGIKP